MRAAEDVLVLCSRLERGEIDSAEFFERFTRALAGHIGCSRAGVWMFVDAGASLLLRCIAMYDAPTDRMVQVGDIASAKDGAYFETLMRDDCVNAPNARTDPATAGFLADYLLPLDVHSLLDVCFSVNGVPFGIFSCEQAGAPTEWTAQQLRELRQIGSRASLTLMHAATASIDTTPGALWESSGSGRFTALQALDDPAESAPAEPGDRLRPRR